MMYELIQYIDVQYLLTLVRNKDEIETICAIILNCAEIRACLTLLSANLKQEAIFQDVKDTNKHISSERVPFVLLMDMISSKELVRLKKNILQLMSQHETIIRELDQAPGCAEIKENRSKIAEEEKTLYERIHALLKNLEPILNIKIDDSLQNSDKSSEPNDINDIIIMATTACISSKKRGREEVIIENCSLEQHAQMLPPKTPLSSSSSLAANEYNDNIAVLSRSLVAENILDDGCGGGEGGGGANGGSVKSKSNVSSGSKSMASSQEIPIL